jgi:hypothetical protein
MDFEIVPEIKTSEKERMINEEAIRKLVHQSDKT